ncbi:MAG: prepilin-type N-terminal cleavage/methylation domain-containing protein [Paucibacter sp.]|nr:prepilin-type N-terminal cleavage/methylation domain-containing protein [Roseateles sp.]
MDHDAQTPRHRHRHHHGFSLIELMIVLAVVGITSAIAMSSYQQYMARTRRSEAYKALESVALAQERYRSNHASYATNLADLGGAPPSANYELRLIGVGEPANFVSGYAVHAHPKAGSLQARDLDCADIYIQVDHGQARNMDGHSASTPGHYACWPQ